MSLRPPHRQPVKNTRLKSPTSGSSTPSWRDQIREKCVLRIRQSRQERLAGLRTGNTALDQEPPTTTLAAEPDHPNAPAPKAFTENEYRIMREEYQFANLSIEDGIELDLEILRELEQLHWQEEANAMDARADEQDQVEMTDDGDAFVCMACQRGQLVQLAEDQIACSSCPLDLRFGAPQTTRGFYDNVVQLCNNHSQVCLGQPLFMFDKQVGLVVICSVCEHFEALA